MLEYTLHIDEAVLLRLYLREGLSMTVRALRDRDGKIEFITPHLPIDMARKGEPIAFTYESIRIVTEYRVVQVWDADELLGASEHMEDDFWGDVEFFLCERNAPGVKWQ